ncbi:MAG: hypothetical protein NZ483_04200 [Verrucomicrobiae bacterium]|nr:hypothetical protein [Verrucomicrobiae bacterium]MDW8343124.1 hypothetical protein [Verrucomicrobiae bacterium]
MKSVRPLNGMAQRARALEALKAGIIAGATHDYERLVNAALQAGATEEEIDLLIHDALSALFESAEQPVGPRELAYLWPAARSH